MQTFSKPPTQRQLKVGEEMRHVLAQVMQTGRFRDPMLRDSTVTVTEVRIGPDLRNATAYVMPLGGRNAAAVVAALNTETGLFRSHVARKMRLKFSPAITFAEDTTFAESDRLTRLLRGETKVLDGIQGEE